MEKNDITIFITSILWNDKKKIALYSIVAGIIGVVIAFGVPRIYKSSVILAPEQSSNSGFSGSISTLASMVGMDMMIGGDDAIYPEIYPDLMASTDFIVQLFPIKVNSLKGNIKDMSYYDYLSSKQKKAWWTFPLTLKNKIINSLKKDTEEENNRVDPFRLTKKQYDITKKIGSNLDCSVDKKTSVISITVTDQDPLIAATMADSVKSRLQVFITNYRTNKARNDLEYMEKLYREAKDQYAKARQVYASYADANQDVMLQSFRAKQEELENEMQLKYDIYSQVVQQLQLTKAKVQEKTPAFTVVQSATVPIRHSNKPKVIYLLGFMILGFFIRICYDLYKNRKEFLE